MSRTTAWAPSDEAARGACYRRPVISVGALLGTFVGPWELLELVGRGGMGAVFRAKHRVTQREAAVKLLDPSHFEADPHATERFVREVSAPARIKHPGIVEVLDAGRNPEVGTHYVVMELLVGDDLRRLIDRGGLDVERALAIVLSLLDPLAAAHRAGLVHRDLKPENTFLVTTPDGRSVVKLLDFGIARDLGGPGATATQTSMGTPYYMAPEQMRSARHATPSADVWSVGVMLFEMLAGARPFQGDSYPAIVLAVATEPPPAMPERVPAPVREVVRRCLEKDPTKRPAEAAALRSELLAALGRPSAPSGIDALAETARPEPAAPLGVAAAPTAAVPAPMHRGPWYLAAAAAVLAALGLGAWPAAAPPAPPTSRAPALSGLPSHATASGTVVFQPLAAADAGFDEDEYRRVVTEALGEFDANDYHEAFALFRRAHALRPSARTLRGLSMTAFELRHYVECIGFGRESLVSDVVPLTDEQRAALENLIRRAERYTARIVVQASPEIADVTVNGTPAESHELVLDIGEYVVSINAPGYAPVTRTITVQGGENETMVVELAPGDPG